MRKVFHVIGWTVVIALPWTWMFSWHIWLQLLKGAKLLASKKPLDFSERLFSL